MPSYLSKRISIAAIILILAGCTSTPTTGQPVPPTQTVPLATTTVTTAPTSIQTIQPTIEPTFTVMAATIIPTETQILDTLAGKMMAESVCIICHSFDRVEISQKSLAEWETTVIRMVGHGAVLSLSEQQLVVQYLAQTYK